MEIRNPKSAIRNRKKISSAKTQSSEQSRRGFHRVLRTIRRIRFVRRPRSAAKFQRLRFTDRRSSRSRISTKSFGFINETALFKGQWQYKQGRKTPEEYKKILEETVYPKFAEIKAKAIREKLLEAKLVYGYFPCHSQGNDLIIYQDDERTERPSIRVPASAGRTARGERIFVSQIISHRLIQARVDTVAFQLVTMGKKASEHSAKLFKADNYTDYLLFHGCRWNRQRLSQRCGTSAFAKSSASREAMLRNWRSCFIRDIRVAIQFRISCVSESRRPDEAVRASRSVAYRR
jgi:cobalamin-dependent methionine synthase I